MGQSGSDGPLSMDPWMIGTLAAGLGLLLAVCAAALFLMCRGERSGGSAPAVGALTPGKGGALENLAHMGAYIQDSPGIRRIRCVASLPHLCAHWCFLTPSTPPDHTVSKIPPIVPSP